jgi:hypothetical protein
MNKDKAHKDTALGLMVIILGLIIVGLTLWWLFTHIKQEVAASLLVGVLTATAAIWTARSTKLRDRELQIQAQQSTRREEVATRFMENFWNIAQNNFKSEEIKEKYMKDTLKDFMINGSLWLSDETLKIFVEYRLAAQSGAGSNTIAKYLAKLMLGFRSDLGHKNKNLTEKDMLDVFINDTDSVFK